MKFTMAYDPVTRIEGHLKIEADLDKVNGVFAGGQCKIQRRAFQRL